jgi:hypothetical protein
MYNSMESFMTVRREYVAEANDTFAATDLFRDQLEVLEGEFPEIAGHAGEIALRGDSLIIDHGFKESFFTDPARALVFSALTLRHIEHRRSREKPLAEKRLINESLKLLVASHNESEDLLKEQSSLMSVYDDFTHPELTALMRGFVEEGGLDKVKRRLRVSPGNEDPYDLRVLAYSTLGGASGLLPARNFWDDDKDIEENQRILRQLKDVREVVNEYHRGLTKKQKEFTERTGEDVSSSAGFVVTVGGKRLLCLPMPLAEKILYPELTQYSDYDTWDYRFDYAVLSHEYTHTQGRADLFPNVISFGIGLEERRADFFSGIPTYVDMFGLHTDLHLATGWDVRDLFRSNPKGGTPYEIYGDFALRFGLKNLVDLLGIIPDSYRRRHKRLSVISDIIGPVDQFIGDLLDREKEAGRGSRIIDRVDAYIDSSDTPEREGYQVDPFNRKALGLKTIGKIIVDRQKERRGPKKLNMTSPL